MSGNIRLYNTNGYVELQAPSSATNQTLVLPTDSIQPGLVHLHTETFSAVSSVSIDNVFSAEYANYFLTGFFKLTSGAIQMRMRASGTDNTTTNYRNTQIALSGSATVNGYYTLGSLWDAFSANTNASGFSVHMQNPFATEYTTMQSTCNYSTGYDTTAHTHNVASSFDGFSVFANTGGATFSGSIRIYGYRNS